MYEKKKREWSPKNCTENEKFNCPITTSVYYMIIFMI